jgi:hypothetical protein
VADKAELIITALQQRIGEIVSNYETQVAFLRAEITTILEEQQNKDMAADQYNQSLINKIEILVF